MTFPTIYLTLWLPFFCNFSFASYSLSFSSALYNYNVPLLASNHTLTHCLLQCLSLLPPSLIIILPFSLHIPRHSPVFHSLLLPSSHTHPCHHSPICLSNNMAEERGIHLMSVRRCVWEAVSSACWRWRRKEDHHSHENDQSSPTTLGTFFSPQSLFVVEIWFFFILYNGENAAILVIFFVYCFFLLYVHFSRT